MIQCVLFVIMFMASLETSALTTSLPTIISSLGQMPLYPFMNGGFYVASLIATPVFGNLSDRMGTKKAMLIALFIFIIGSLLSGLSTSMQYLILARIIQGIGSGSIVCLGFIMVANIYEHDEHRSLMLGLMSVAWTCGSVFGPMIGAFLAESFSWRWIFFVNVPICSAALILLYFSKIPQIQKSKHPFDLKGLILFSLSLISIFFGLQLKALGNTYSLYEYLLIAFGIVMFLFFAKRSLYSHNALIPIKLLKKPQVFLCIVTGLIIGFCLTVSSSLLSIYMKGACRTSLYDIGIVVTTMSIGWSIGSLSNGVLLKKVSMRFLFILGAVSLLFGFIRLDNATIASTTLYFVVTNFFVGIGLGILMNSTMVSMQRVSHSDSVGSATSFLSITRNLGCSLGYLVGGILQIAFFKVQIENNKEFFSKDTFELLMNRPDKFLLPTFPNEVLKEELAKAQVLFSSAIEQVFNIPIWLLSILLLAFVFTSSDWFVRPKRKMKEDLSNVVA